MPARTVYFEGPNEVTVRTTEVPSPAADEVLVATRVSGVSPGTERLVYRHDVPSDLAVDDVLSAFDGTFEYPLRYGYAAVGEVVAVGDDVDSAWTGRRVFAFVPHQSHFTATPAELHPLPDGVSADRATLLPTVETAVTLAMDLGPRLGERVVVFGAGVVGLATTGLLAQYPLETLVVVDPVERRRELALSAGADEAVAPSTVRTRFGATSDAGTGADHALEVSGNPAALDDAIAVTGYDGHVVVGSWYGDSRSTLDLGGRYHRSRIAVESSQVSTIDPARRGRWTRERRLETAWEHLGRLPFDHVPVARRPVTDAPDVYARLDDGPPEAVRILFTYES